MIRNDEVKISDKKGFTTYIAEMVDCNTIEVEAGTTGYRGGDSGHGGKTYFHLKNLSGTDAKATVTKDKYEEFEEVEIELGGDAELRTFIESLKFAIDVLEKQLGDKKKKHMIELDKVVVFIEHKYKVKLYNYQIEALRHIMAGEKVFTPRQTGRSILLDGYATYLKTIEDRDTHYDDYNYRVLVDEIIKSGHLTQEHIDQIKHFCSEESFRREFIGNSTDKID